MSEHCPLSCSGSVGPVPSLGHSCGCHHCCLQLSPGVTTAALSCPPSLQLPWSRPCPRPEPPLCPRPGRSCPRVSRWLCPDPGAAPEWQSVSQAAEICPGLLPAPAFGDRAHLQRARWDWPGQSCRTGLMVWHPRHGGAGLGRALGAPARALLLESQPGSGGWSHRCHPLPGGFGMSCGRRVSLEKLVPTGRTAKDGHEAGKWGFGSHRGAAG